ncbi:MAG: hypothetical protein PsegKO_28620 [Pseudohongiellaceae bacterium]
MKATRGKAVMTTDEHSAYAIAAWQRFDKEITGGRTGGGECVCLSGGDRR